MKRRKVSESPVYAGFLNWERKSENVCLQTGKSDVSSLKSGARSKTFKTAHKEEGQGNLLSDTKWKRIGMWFTRIPVMKTK